MCVAAAQQHSSRIYRNKNDPENREALSSRSFACKTAWIIQNEIEFESRRGHESSVRFFLFFFFFLLFFWFRIDWKMIRPTCATTPSCVNTGNINSARFYRGVEFRQVDIRKKKKKKEEILKYSWKICKLVKIIFDKSLSKWMGIVTHVVYWKGNFSISKNRVILYWIY